MEVVLTVDEGVWPGCYLRQSCMCDSSIGGALQGALDAASGPKQRGRGVVYERFGSPVW
jgi:hypothetical protein